MTRNQQDLVRVSEAAALWVQRLDHSDSAQTRAEFDKWLRQGGPTHMEEFLLAQMTWENLDRLDATLNLGSPQGNESVVKFPPVRVGESTPAVVRAVAAEPRATAETVSESGLPATVPASQLQKTKRTRIWPWTAGLAASLIMATALFMGVWPFGSQVYATAVGRQEAVKLPDGSIIHLNTHSRAEVRFSENLREVLLRDGEALFTVAHDARRPFFVVTESARIRAIGTQFNVYRTGTNATRVSVLEGVVQVTPVGFASSAIGARRGDELPTAGEVSTTPAPSPQSGAGRGEDVLRLAAGDEAEVDAWRIVKASTPDVQRAVAWRARRLVFVGDRIDHIATEFNRYNRIQIRVEGAVRERRMGGTFDADDPMPMVRYLMRDPNVVVVQSEAEILIRPRNAADPM
jgi:transmembrane sensor